MHPPKAAGSKWVEFPLDTLVTSDQDRERLVEWALAAVERNDAPQIKKLLRYGLERRCWRGLRDGTAVSNHSTAAATIYRLRGSELRVWEALGDHWVMGDQGIHVCTTEPETERAGCGLVFFSPRRDRKTSLCNHCQSTRVTWPTYDGHQTIADASGFDPESPAVRILRVCKGCGEPFEATRRDKEHCGPGSRCRVAAHRGRAGDG